MQEEKKNIRRNPILSFFKSWGFFCFLILLVLGLRYYCIESYRISTRSMEEALYKGDYVLVNKLPAKNNPKRNRVVLLTSPLIRDSISKPVFAARCIGMPGDILKVDKDGYEVNGKAYPRSPLALASYQVGKEIKGPFFNAFEQLSLPTREWKEDSITIKIELTSFEEYQLREELTELENFYFEQEETEGYTILIPRKGYAYPIDPVSLIACREAILTETNGKAIIKEDKVFLNGKQLESFVFSQDYYWVLSDNIKDAVDSRHLGFIPTNHIIGNVFFCWYSQHSRRIFKPVK